MMNGTESNVVFAKVCVLVLSVGVVACALLALRQQRLDAVGAMTATQLRIMQQDRDLSGLRARIAASLTPDQLATKAAAFGALKPIEVRPPVRVEVPGPSVARRDDGNPHDAAGGGVIRRR